MMRVYATMAQKERELISKRKRAALAAAKARWAVLGGDHLFERLYQLLMIRTHGPIPAARWS